MQRSSNFVLVRFSPGAERDGRATKGLLEIRRAEGVAQRLVQVQVDARLRQEVGRVGELHG